MSDREKIEKVCTELGLSPADYTLVHSEQKQEWHLFRAHRRALKAATVRTMIRAIRRALAQELTQA